MWNVKVKLNCYTFYLTALLLGQIELGITLDAILSLFFHMHIYRRSEAVQFDLRPKIFQAISYHLTPNDRRFDAF